MRFQTMNQHRVNGRILAGGQVHVVDEFGCVDAKTDEAVADFRGMPEEWSESIREVSPLMVNRVKSAEAKTAADLARDITQDPALRTALAGMTSKAVRRSWLEIQGYRFTDEEMAAAFAPHLQKAQHQPAVVSSAHAALTAQYEMDDDQKARDASAEATVQKPAGNASPAPGVVANVPEVEPSEDDHAEPGASTAADPLAGMAMNDLRAQAKSLGVVANVRAKKADLIRSIREALSAQA